MSKEFTVRIYKNTGNAYVTEDTKVDSMEAALAQTESIDHHAYHIYSDDGSIVGHGWGNWSKSGVSVTPAAEPAVEKPAEAPVEKAVATPKKAKKAEVVEVPKVEEKVEEPAPTPAEVEKVEEPVAEAPTTEQPAE